MAAASAGQVEGETGPLVAIEGDVVTVTYVCKGQEGEVVSSSETEGPLTFKIGAGEAFKNPLFRCFDTAVRGLAAGQAVEIEASGGEWRKELLFTIPKTHQEIERLEGRYAKQGGLQEGGLVQLANNEMALVTKITDETVQLDANNMFAGRTLVFEVVIEKIERS